MTYCPNMGETFENSYASYLNISKVLEIIDTISAENVECVIDEEYVIAKRSGNGIMLLSSNYLLNYPNGHMCPIMQLNIREKDNGNGTLIEYKLDIEKSPVAIICGVLTTCILIGAMMWLVCSIFASFNLIGIILSSILMFFSGMIFVKKLLSPIDIMLITFKKYIPPIS